MSFTVKPLSPVFGAQIEGLDLAQIDDAAFAQLYAAWLKHHVLVLRAQSLYLGRRRNAYVAGLPLKESEALLDELWQYAALPANLYRHQWRVGDVVLWDNRTTMHRREAFDPASARTMHRSQIKAKGSINHARLAA